jgi:hypothetical protein
MHVIFLRSSGCRVNPGSRQSPVTASLELLDRALLVKTGSVGSCSSELSARDHESALLRHSSRPRAAAVFSLGETSGDHARAGRGPVELLWAMCS